MIQHLDELRGPALATLLKRREDSLRETTGTGSLSRHQTRRSMPVVTCDAFDNKLQNGENENN